MKKILLITLFIAFAAISRADDRPVTKTELPAAAQTFINANFPTDRISYATKDDDFIRPDYNVVFVSGARVTFNYNGALEKITVGSNPMPENVVPVQIEDYVRTHYPQEVILEYEIDRRSYDVKLSNRMELKFNRNFALIGIDN